MTKRTNALIAQIPSTEYSLEKMAGFAANVKTLTLKVIFIIIYNLLERQTCNRCNKNKLEEEEIISFDIDDKDSKDPNKKILKSELLQLEADFKLKKPFVERPGDWVCIKCKNLNFAFRIHCNRCKTSKQTSNMMLEAYLRGEGDPAFKDGDEFDIIKPIEL